MDWKQLDQCPCIQALPLLLMHSRKQVPTLEVVGTPVGTFSRLSSDTLIGHLVEETNSYAQQEMKSERDACKHAQWEHTNIPETCQMSWTLQLTCGSLVAVGTSIE